MELLSRGTLSLLALVMVGQAPTAVHPYTVPAALPQQQVAGVCAARSVAGALRRDAVRCIVAGTIHDPCFTTGRPDVVLCDVDPRDAARGVVVKSSPPAAAIDVPAVLSRAWFIELADGSMCRPVIGTPRAFDGETEIYTCVGSVGDADSVMLGDVDDSAPLWTIKRAVLNKKFTPQTIKSLSVVAVKAVWR